MGEVKGLKEREKDTHTQSNEDYKLQYVSEGKEQDATVENAAGLLQKDAAKDAVPTGAWSLGRALKLKGRRWGRTVCGGADHKAVSSSTCQNSRYQTGQGLPWWPSG